MLTASWPLTGKVKLAMVGPTGVGVPGVIATVSPMGGPLLSRVYPTASQVLTLGHATASSFTVLGVLAPGSVVTVTGSMASGVPLVIGAMRATGRSLGEQFDGPGNTVGDRHDHRTVNIRAFGDCARRNGCNADRHTGGGGGTRHRLQINSGDRLDRCGRRRCGDRRSEPCRPRGSRSHGRNGHACQGDNNSGEQATESRRSRHGQASASTPDTEVSVLPPPVTSTAGTDRAECWDCRIPPFSPTHLGPDEEHPHRPGMGSPTPRFQSAALRECFIGRFPAPGRSTCRTAHTLS